MGRRRAQAGCHSFDPEALAAPSAPSASGGRGRGRTAPPPRGGAGRRRRAASDPYLISSPKTKPKKRLWSLSSRGRGCSFVNRVRCKPRTLRNDIRYSVGNAFITQSIYSIYPRNRENHPPAVGCGACPWLMANGENPLCQRMETATARRGDVVSSHSHTPWGVKRGRRRAREILRTSS